MLLEIKDLSVDYGGIHALRNVSLALEEKSIVTIIGANGAGKSTLLNAIMNIAPVNSGGIFFENKNIIGLPTQKIVKKGISLVPEGRMLFSHLTVKDNIYLGSYLHFRNVSKSEINKSSDKVYELFPIMKERKRQIAGTLSGGQQQMLAIARALMASPKLLILDEPSMGLAPLIVKDIFHVLRILNQEGISILLVEQNARAALKLSHYGYVLEAGEVASHGRGEDLLHDEEVKKAYLGG